MIIIVVFAVTGVVSAAENVTDDAVSVEEMTVGLNFEKDTNYICNDTNVISYKSNDDMADKLNYAFNDGSFKDLSDDIANANGELNLSRNYVFDSSDSANAIVVEKPIIINGNGHNILAESKTSVFSITASNVILKNINFYDSSGGSINWQGSNGTLINCKFEDCKNTGNGGAIYWKNDKNGLISNCTFKRCTSTNEGGALYLDDTHIKIENCDFIDNVGSTSSGNGCGAIYVGGGKINIDNCTFNHNVAGSGGAIRGGNSAGSIINNSKFINNTNLAILWNGNNFEIDNSIFIDNSNQVSKGFGPYAPINSAGTLNAYGGAVRISGDYTKISNSVFNKNKISATIRSNVDRYKDPIFNQWNYYNIRETFHINTYGGAISVNGNKFYINNISCTDNLAYSSGYVNVQYQSSTYSLVDMNMEQYIYANSYGGAIYLNGGGILSNAFISENKLDGYANVNKGIVPAQNCKIICEVKGYGVGVYWDGYSRNNLVNNSVFIQNNLSSGQTGSALYLNNFKGDVNYNIFLQNPEKVIDSSASEFSADYNWWGNTFSNFNQQLCTNDLGITKWLFLNMSSNNSNLEIGDNAIVTLDLTNVYDSSSNTISHISGINDIDFNLVGNKIKTNVSSVVLNNGVANVEIQAQTYGQGSLAASYNGLTSTLTFTISKKQSQVKTQINNCSVYKEELIAYLNVTPNATGTLKVYLNNDLHSSIVLNGNNELSIDLTGLNANNYTLYATYNGDENYSGSSDTIKFEIKKADNNIQISDPYNVNYGETITLNVNKGTVTDGTLFVEIKNNNTSIYEQSYNIMNINKITLPLLNAGDYNLFINYTSNNYYNSNFSSTFTVNKLNPVINKRIISTVYGKSEIMFNSSTDGILKLNILNNTYRTFNIKSNKDTSLNLSDIDAGDYEIEFVFIPNSQNYNNATSKTPLTIFKAEPAFIITIKDINYLESAILNINYLNNITGFANITISNDEGFEIKYSNVTLSNGNFNRELNNLNASKYTVTFAYSGNNNYYSTTQSKTFNVFKIDPIMMAEVTNSTYGQTAKITVNCNAEGNITITVGSVKTYPELIITDKKVSQNVNDIDAGTYDVTVTYNGNNNYNIKTVNTKLTIYKVSTTVIATVDDITYSQTAVVNVKASVNGEVTVKIDNTYINNTNVVANTVTPITFNNVPAGSHNISVVLTPSNKNYNESSYNTEFTVSKKQTSIILGAENSVYGEEVIINVTASEDGKITLKVGDITRERNVLANTMVKINFGVLAVDSYNVEATFNAGENYKPSNKQTTLVVSPAKAEITSIQVQNNTYGENTIINVKTNVAGVLTVKLNNANAQTFNIDANKLTSLDLGKYDADNYDIGLTLDAGSNYTKATGNADITVNPKQTTVELNVNNNVYSKNIIVNVTASENGKVTVNVGTNARTVDVEANKCASIDFGILDAKSYEVNATFDGGKNYQTSSDKTSLVVSPKSSTVTLVDFVNSYVYSQNVIIKMKSDNNGALTVKVGDTPQTKQVTAENTVTFDFGILDVNTYGVTISLDAGNNYIPYQNTTSITVSPKSTTVTLIDPVNSYTYSENVIIKLKTDVDGTLTVKVGDTPQTKQATAGNVVTFDFGILDVNSYEVTINLTAGNNYVPFQNTTSITIAPKSTSIALNAKDYDTTEKVIVNVTASENGKVSIKLGGITKTIDVNANTLTSVDFGLLDVGSYDIVANFTAGNNYMNSTDTGNVKVVSKIKEDDVNISIPDIIANQENQIVINLPSDATGTVTLSIGNNTYPFTVNNGVATVKVPKLEDGTYEYIIKYSGDNNYSSFSTSGNINVSKPTPDVEIPPLDKPSSDGSITINLPKGATGTVTLVIDKKPYSFPVQNGVAKIYMPELANGNYPYTITYSGDGRYSSFTKTGTLTVNKQTTPAKAVTKTTLTLKKVTVKRSAKKLIIQATLKVNGKVIKGKTIKFKFNKKTYKAKTNAKGIAKVTIKKAVLKKLKKGKKVTYTATYGKITKKVIVKVKK
ncbi:Ig-like domain repeat protein [Methanobrevibacter sp.]